MNQSSLNSLSSVVKVWFSMAHQQALTIYDSKYLLSFKPGFPVQKKKRE